MALIPLANIDDLNGTPREVAESGQAQYGRVLNTWAAIMNKPDLFAAYLPFLRRTRGRDEGSARAAGCLVEPLSLLAESSRHLCVEERCERRTHEAGRLGRVGLARATPAHSA